MSDQMDQRRDEYIRQLRESTDAVIERVRQSEKITAADLAFTVGVPNESSELAALRGALAQAQLAHSHLSQLLRHCAPQCEPLPELPGLATQIDNYIAGCHEQLATARAAIREMVDEMTRASAAQTIGIGQQLNWRDRLAALGGK